MFVPLKGKAGQHCMEGIAGRLKATLSRGGEDLSLDLSFTPQ
jgi:hypothetical protein